MASPEETQFFDLYNFERNLREKINELQWKSESLEEAQKELFETRRTLFQTRTELEDERRSTKQLQMQLKTALETAMRLEEESIKNQAEQVHLRLKFETSSIERALLIDQARIVRLENMDLKIKIEDCERNLVRSKMTNENLEASFVELNNSVTKLHNKLHSNVGKLEREQEQLRESCEASMKFGQRVQAILKNCHVARQRDKRVIGELKKRVEALNVSGESTAQVCTVAEASDIGWLHLKIGSTLQELRTKLESNSIDEKLSSLCSELQKINASSVKDLSGLLDDEETKASKNRA